jgi:glutathione S-transferase
MVLWETAAIYLYVIEKYDTDRRLTYDSFEERHYLNQWLAFQVSGQGPYYGQAGWSVLQPANNAVRLALGRASVKVPRKARPLLTRTPC